MCIPHAHCVGRFPCAFVSARMRADTNCPLLRPRDSESKHVPGPVQTIQFPCSQATAVDQKPWPWDGVPVGVCQRPKSRPDGALSMRLLWTCSPLLAAGQGRNGAGTSLGTEVQKNVTRWWQFVA